MTTAPFPCASVSGLLPPQTAPFLHIRVWLLQAAAGRFGSGWAWLGMKEGKLVITSTPNQVRHGCVCVCVCVPLLVPLC